MKRIVLLVAFALAAPVRAEDATPVTPPPGTADVFRQFADILDCLQKNYVEPSQIRAREHGPAAFRAFVRALDPDAAYLTPAEAAAARQPEPSATTNAPVTVLSPGLAYCRLSALTAPAVEQLATELPRVRKLILDLRDNPGGSFDAALRAAGLFLPAKAEVVTLDYADPGHRTKFVSAASDNKCTAPLVVLVNGGTAAEAEVFAAALQTHQRTRLVGSPTAGRGRLISMFPLADGAALRLPTARFLMPTGRSFDGRGLTPDVVVDAPATDAAPDPVLTAARQLLAK